MLVSERAVVKAEPPNTPVERRAKRPLEMIVEQPSITPMLSFAPGQHASAIEPSFSRSIRQAIAGIKGTTAPETEVVKEPDQTVPSKPNDRPGSGFLDRIDSFQTDPADVRSVLNGVVICVSQRLSVCALIPRLIRS